MDTLHRQDFCFGPISIDLIEPNLYLGGLAAAKDLDTLQKYKISHILTIDTCPLTRQITGLSYITSKFIQLSDQPKEDLLSYFDETNAFITDCINSNGTVFVHCYFGVSRSATVVIAYIMKKYSMSYHEAFEKVKLKRNIVFPNQGFVTQLKLYKQMNYIIDKSNMFYKVYRLGLAADRVRKVKILPQNFMDLIKADPGLTQTKPEPNVYRCRKCRRILAGESNLITHFDKDALCKRTYFIEPLAWMNATQNTQGKLFCPKCNGKVGSFSWVMGCECPCGVKTAPAFYLTPSKIDFTDVVKNVEMTF